VEIACDESGFSGTNLVHSDAPLITHASVDLTRDESVELISSSPRELKSGPFLRRGGAADALLAQLPGRARVCLIDKELFLVNRILDLMLSEPFYLAGTRLAPRHRPAAAALRRAGREAGADWTAFLEAFVDLARTKRRQPVGETTQRFLRARDTLARHRLGEPAEAVLGELTDSRVRGLAHRLDRDDPAVPPPLEPMVPALAETVLAWSGAAEGRRRVLVFHDEQSALTAGRLTRLGQALAAADGRSPLAGLIMVDSRDDPRVQVADLLAGVARRRPESPLLRPLLIDS
jgi:hypothetical protein